MAHLPRGLCVTLVMWLALSRSSTASRTESPDSGQWWRTQQFEQIQKAAAALYKAGDYAALEKLYVKAVEQARASKNMRAQASYLTALGNTYVYLFRYPDAIHAYVNARDLAHANSDWLAEGAVAPGLSSVYLLVGDWPAARESAQAGLEAAKRLPSRPYYEAQLKLQHARLNAGADGTPAEILQAIESARARPDAVLEAEAWDLLGEERMRRRDLPGAEVAFEEAFRIRSLQARQDLRLSYWRLGSLRLAQNRLEEAEQFTATAIEQLRAARSADSSRSLLLQRGLIRQARGNTELALQDFEAAVRSAEHWRQVVPPLARTSLVAADTEADRKIVSTFVEAAARKGTSPGGEKWAKKALLAAERNRAVSLHQSAALAEVWRRKLPTKYWQTLAELRAEETRELHSNGTLSEDNAAANSLHLALTEMENIAGLGYSPNKLENFSSERSLSLFQKGLRESELFLSFHTGAGESYLWAVTRDSLNLYRLPAAKRIEETVQYFRNAVTQHQAKAASLGEHLYGVLFGQLNASEAGRANWLLSLDGPLFDAPLGALRVGSQYLVESHTLQVTPSATWLQSAKPVPGANHFVAVADPIYNWADERLRPAEWSVRQSPYQIPGQLNRLVASGEEVRRITGVWGKGQGVVLAGQQASRRGFLEAIARSQPTHVYLATHVVASSTKRDQAFLAFSLGDGGSPELMGTVDIAMLKVPGALVVMSGCASGAGTASPGAGLLGLTRAWLSAGAQAVVSTAWPMEDSFGELLPEFYRNLTARSNSVSTAEALRRGQVAMIRSGNWQADPAYWAAFQITGGVR